MVSYSSRFFNSESYSAKKSAEAILPYILDLLQPKTIVDFGCGTGEWLNVAKNYQKEVKILGIDGYASEYLVISKDDFITADLKKEIDLNRRFDLAISLEVAEHLPAYCAATFIETLVKHSDTVLFSAAIPFQGGTTHINEQYQSYWKALFEKNGYLCCDCLRENIWDMENVSPWYKQNIFLYVKTESQKTQIMEKFHTDKTIENMIHPDMWEYKINRQYLFPFTLVGRGSKVIIYGAGPAGRAYMNQLAASGWAEAVLWCDKNYEAYKNTFPKFNVFSPDIIRDMEYDYIVLAVEKEETSKEICEELEIKYHVHNSRILWESPLLDILY